MKDETSIDPTSEASEKTVKEAEKIVRWVFWPLIAGGLLLAVAWYLRLARLLFTN